MYFNSSIFQLAFGLIRTFSLRYLLAGTHLYIGPEWSALREVVVRSSIRGRNDSR